MLDVRRGREICAASDAREKRNSLWRVFRGTRRRRLGDQRGSAAAAAEPPKFRPRCCPAAALTITPFSIAAARIACQTLRRSNHTKSPFFAARGYKHTRTHCSTHTQTRKAKQKHRAAGQSCVSLCKGLSREVVLSRKKGPLSRRALSAKIKPFELSIYHGPRHTRTHAEHTAHNTYIMTHTVQAAVGCATHSKSISAAPFGRAELR